MSDGPPKLIAIDHDDYHAEYVGRTQDGRQFFLTTPFSPELGSEPGCEYVALYIFDKAGVLLEAKIDSLGPRGDVDETKSESLIKERLRELGKVKFRRIEVAPFAVERFGTIFGLIACEPEEEDDEWSVELQPGNYMAFFPPWDSGEYDT